VGNRFITQIWTKGGRELARNEARALLDEVRKTHLLSPSVFSCFKLLNILYNKFFRLILAKSEEPKLKDFGVVLEIFVTFVRKMYLGRKINVMEIMKSWLVIFYYLCNLTFICCPLLCYGQNHLVC
jgi:hypothetical protein